MLAEQPRSGYEILQFMKQSTAHFWQESDASIYPMLKLLEKEGKVTSKQEFQGKRERRIFEITQAGLDEVQAWLTLPAQEDNRRSEFLLKLFFGALIDPQKVHAQLQEHLKKVEVEKKNYQVIEKKILPKILDTNPHKLFWSMTLHYGITQCISEQHWLEKSLEVIQKREKQNNTKTASS